MKKMKLGMLLIIGLTSAIYSDEVKYICPPTGIIDAIADGKKVDTSNLSGVVASERYLMKTEWYGKPIYIAKVRKKENLIYKNTQSKLEWIQSDSMLFTVKGDERGSHFEMSISLEKGSSPIMTHTWIADNAKFKKAVFRVQCYKE